MADDVPEETSASQEVVKDAGRAAARIGIGLFDLARALMASRTSKGFGREIAVDGAASDRSEATGRGASSEAPVRVDPALADRIRAARIEEVERMRRLQESRMRRRGLMDRLGLSHLTRNTPEGRVRRAAEAAAMDGVVLDADATLAVTALSRGPKMPTPLPLALMLGRGGMGR